MQQMTYQYILKSVFLILFCSCLLACQDKPQSETQNQCFAYTKNRDTVMLSLKFRGDQVSGDLIYSLFEKDRNSGTVNGKMLGDTLLLDYNFGSEGRQSVRQVAFLKKGDQLKEGYGEVLEKNGKVEFKQPAGLKFDGIIVLHQVDCKH